MRIYLLIVLLILSVSLLLQSNTMGSETQQQRLERIYNRLIKHTGVSHEIPPIKLVKDSTVNAWISSKQITMTTAMLSKFDNDNQVAVIISHEIAHYVLGDLTVLEDVDSRLREANADKYGYYLMMRAGFDICEGENVWLIIQTIRGDNILTFTHPSHSSRIYSAKFPQCQ